MPKTPAFTPTPAIEKLPLAVRKDIRDNYESKRSELEAQIGSLLGVTFVININANEVWAYSNSGSSSAGGLFKGYVEGFIDTLKRYLDTYGDEGKKDFNEVVTKSELTIAVNELGEQADTISADIKDGVFRILFKHTQLGYNQSYLGDSLLKAVEAAPREGFALVAKTSIEKDYNDEIEELTEEINKILGLKDVVLDPNFEENYKALSAAKGSDKSWQANFGKVAYQYFSDGLKYQLGRQGFEGDDMLQEGLAEVSKTFKIRVVKATKNDATNETVIENGIVYLQTTPERWWYNVSDMGSGLIDLL